MTKVNTACLAARRPELVRCRIHRSRCGLQQALQRRETHAV